MEHLTSIEKAIKDFEGQSPFEPKYVLISEVFYKELCKEVSSCLLDMVWGLPIIINPYMEEGFIIVPSASFGFLLRERDNKDKSVSIGLSDKVRYISSDR